MLSSCTRTLGYNSPLCRERTELLAIIPRGIRLGRRESRRGFPISRARYPCLRALTVCNIYVCACVCVSYVYVCVQSTRGTVQRKSSCPAGSRWDGMASCLYQFATDPLALDKLITLQRRSFLLEKTGTCFLSLPDAVRSNQPAV